jgi:hypothetical protein
MGRFRISIYVGCNDRVRSRSRFDLTKLWAGRGGAAEWEPQAADLARVPWTRPADTTGRSKVFHVGESARRNGRFGACQHTPGQCSSDRTPLGAPHPEGRISLAVLSCMFYY